MRGIVIRGPYRLVRHPAYAGEILLLASCCIAQVGWGSLTVFGAALISLGIRIIVEERLLGATPDYQEYRQQVRWRIIPGLW